MPTIPEQIAAAAVADTLGAARTEEEWPKLAWAASRGTFGSGSFGWRPPGFVPWPPTQSVGGAYFAKGGQLSGDAFVSLDIQNTYFLIGGEEGEYRSFSIWLFTDGAGTGNGYQLRLRQWSFGNVTPRLYKFVLSKFVEGEKTLIEESEEVAIETGGGFALAMLGGYLTMWRRETAESEWVQVGESNADETFTEGYAGIDGNGSNPILANLKWAALEAPEPGAITNPATSIGRFDATLNGIFNPLPGEHWYQWWFEYGTTEAYGSQTAKTLMVNPSGAQVVAKVVEGLKPNTKYHFRLRVQEVATGPEGPFLGEDEEFRTLAEGLAPIERIRELPPDRMAIRVDAANGTAARWAEDEPAAENILDDVTIEDEIPGGWRSIKGTLARDPHIDWRDIEEFAEMYAYIQGVEIVGEGFLDKGPSATGERRSINPEALGWQAVLNDDTAAKVGFIDSDLNKWGDPSLGRRRSLIQAAGINLSPQISIGFQDAAAAAPGIQADFSGVGKVAGQLVGNEAWYYGGGIDIGKLRYDFVGDAVGGFVNQGHISTDDVTSSYDSGVNHNSVSASNQTIVATAGRKYALLQNIYGGEFVGQMNNIHSWRNVKVLGSHGLEERGVWPNIGFTAQQMLVWLINNLAQPLYATESSVEDDGFIIPQAWYEDAGGLAAIVDDLVKYALYDWFIYHGKLFEHREPGSYGRFWKARTAPSELNEVGKDSQRLWRSIVVQYTTPSGEIRTVGPPGSNSHTETKALEITDPMHPAVLAERTRRDLLDLRGIGSAEVAIRVGERFLEEANLLNRSGSARLSGYVMDNLGVLYPAACVKSGDWISFTDSSDPSYRKIVRKTYTHKDRSVEIDIDAPPSGLDALLERLQVGLVSLGVA